MHTHTHTHLCMFVCMYTDRLLDCYIDILNNVYLLCLSFIRFINFRNIIFKNLLLKNT